MIIDIHAHCFPDGLASRAIASLSEKAGIPAYTDGTVSFIKGSMAAAGIDLCVIQHIATKPEQVINVNRWAAGIQDGNLLSFGSIHPDFPDWKEEIKWLAASGIKGVKFHSEYQDFNADDTKVYPLYEALLEAGLIILFHAGVDLGYPYPYHCTPFQLSKVLDSFPGARIIAAHMGGYRYWEDVEKYLAGRDVYLDTSFAYNEMGAEAMEKLIRDHGAEKILFGSDTPWTDQAKEVSNIKSLNLTGKELDLILGGNSARLLSL